MIVRDKVVLITGASRGIGLACAEAFASRGSMLSLAARSPVNFPEKHRRECLTTQVDLFQLDQRELLIRRTLDRFGRIDILVNNAGSGLYGPTETADLAAAAEMFQLNLFSAVSLIQLVLPLMQASGNGHIVNVSSIAAQIALPWMTLYSASKAALSAVGSGLRRELRGSPILITDVLPGYVKTGFQQSAVGVPPAGVVAGRRRAISPEQCAEAIVRGVERGARTVVAPASGWLSIVAERVAPSLIDSLLAKMNRSEK